MLGGSNEVVIGWCRVLSSTDWLTLDSEIGRIFEVCRHLLDLYSALLVKAFGENSHHMMLSILRVGTRLRLCSITN